MFEKRGLSPVIATVLLIGLVVVSGLIIFVWFKGFVNEAITKGDQNIQLVCDDVQFDASYSEATEDLAIKNIGSVPIYNFNVETRSPGGFDTKDMKKDIAPTEWPKNGLGEGMAISINVGLEGDITLIPILVGTSQKGKQASFTCDDNQYGYQVPF